MYTVVLVNDVELIISEIQKNLFVLYILLTDFHICAKSHSVEYKIYQTNKKLKK